MRLGISGLGLTQGGLLDVIGSVVAWQPLDDSAALLIHNMTDEASILDTAGVVDEVLDQTANNISALPLNAGSSPSTGTRTLNGLNVVDFAGDDNLRASMTLPADGDVAFVWFGEIDSVTATSTGRFESVISFESGGNDFQLQADGVTGANGFTGHLLGTTGAAANLTGGPYSGPTMVAIIFDFTSGTRKVRVNGTEVLSDAYTGQITATGVLSWMSNRNGAQELDGSQGYGIVTADLTVGNIEKYEGFFAHTFAQTALLPVSHTYKTAAPTLDLGSISGSFDALLKGFVGADSGPLDLTTVFTGANPANYSGLTGDFSLSGDVLTWRAGRNATKHTTISADTDGGPESIVLRTVAAVPEIIIVAGQSQFNEHEDRAPPVNYPGVFTYDAGVVNYAESPLEAGLGGYNLALGTVEALSDANPDKVYLVVYNVVGGAGLDVEFATGGVQFNILVDEVNAARARYPNSPISYILGSHGGGAADTFTTGDQMRDALNTFRTDLLSNVNWAGGTVPYVNGTIFDDDPAKVVLNEGIIEMFEVMDQAFAVDWKSSFTGVDAAHLNDVGKELAATRTVEALTASVAQVPVLNRSGDVLSWEWPSVTDTDAAGPFVIYNPTGGRQAQTVELDISIDGGPFTTTTAAYPTLPAYSVSAGQNVSARLRVTFTGGQTDYSSLVNWTATG